MAMAAEARGGGTLSEIHKNTKRLVVEARGGLETLERSEYSSSSPPEAFDAVKMNIHTILSLSAEMDHLWRSIPNPAQRDLWKRKVEQVEEEGVSLKDSLDKYFARCQRRKQEAQERADLIGRRNGDGSHVLRIYDDEAQAQLSLRSSARMLEENLATGVAILSKYSEQRDRIKRAQRKALDVLNRLGLSNSVLRLIERRNRMDKWIKYAGMVITIIVVIMVWRWRS